MARLRVLLIGSGGREHALAWCIARSPSCEALIVTPGNPGVQGLARTRCEAVAADDQAGLIALAERERVDLVVCGPEAPLVAGLGDAMRARGLAFFGPDARAAEIEGSKAFAKDLMKAAGVPTAAYGVFTDVAAAERFIDAQTLAPVVKADGLCAGKGVVVPQSKDEAKAAVRGMLGDRVLGGAGARVVLEERLTGREVSMMALCDGARVVLLDSAEDHKAVGDGDIGPNTGGMGAVSPSPFVDEALRRRVVATIFEPVVRALAADGRRFRGLLYGGLMLTPDSGPMVIEWNARFGDPETQAVLFRLADDILPWLLGAARGELAPGAPAFSPEASVCVVMAAAGYPGKPRTGDRITGVPSPSDAVAVFHAGTRRQGDELVTAGGRVLGVTARGVDVNAARAAAYAVVDRIEFSGKHARRDIGAREGGTKT